MHSWINCWTRRKFRLHTERERKDFYYISRSIFICRVKRTVAQSGKYRVASRSEAESADCNEPPRTVLSLSLPSRSRRLVSRLGIVHLFMRLILLARINSNPTVAETRIACDDVSRDFRRKTLFGKNVSQRSVTIKYEKSSKIEKISLHDNVARNIKVLRTNLSKKNINKRSKSTARNVEIHKLVGKEIKYCSYQIFDVN